MRAITVLGCALFVVFCVACSSGSSKTADPTTTVTGAPTTNPGEAEGNFSRLEDALVLAARTAPGDYSKLTAAKLNDGIGGTLFVPMRELKDQRVGFTATGPKQIVFTTASNASGPWYCVVDDNGTHQYGTAPASEAVSTFAGCKNHTEPRPGN